MKKISAGQKNIIHLFEDLDGDRLTIEEVLTYTGIKSKESLAVQLSNIRKSGVADIIIKWGYVVKQ